MIEFGMASSLSDIPIVVFTDPCMVVQLVVLFPQIPYASLLRGHVRI